MSGQSYHGKHSIPHTPPPPPPNTLLTLPSQAICFQFTSSISIILYFIVHCCCCCCCCCSVTYDGIKCFLLSRMKEPEYQCFREKVGCAKTLDDFDRIGAELKSLLLVMQSISSLKCMASHTCMSQQQQ